MARRLVGGPGDIDGNTRLDLGVELNADLMQAERLDRPVEHHLAPVDGEAALGDRRGDVASGNRAVELTALARLTDDDEALAVELGRNAMRIRFQLEIPCLELRPVALEALAIGLGGAERLALRQQKIAGEAVLDGDHVAHLSEAPNALEQNDLHVRHSYPCQIVPLLLGGGAPRLARWRKPSSGSARPRMATMTATQPSSKMPR